MVLADTAKVIHDCIVNKKKKSKDLDTGAFKCVYKGKV